MAGIIKVNQYQDFNGNTLFTSDGNGNLTTMKVNEPYFEVTLSTSNQVISDETDTKIAWNDVNFDTNSNWNSSNYRWLPTVAGKYFVYLQVGCNAQGSSQLTDHFGWIEKNGSMVSRSHNNPQTGGFYYNTLNTNIILTMNGSTDYVEGWTRMNDTSGSPEVQSGLGYSKFGAYRIGS
jgi:hypothetical protein